MRRRGLIALVLGAIACSGGGGDGGSSPPVLPVVSVVPGTVSLTGAGQTATLTAQVTRNGTSDGSAAVQWSSSNSAVATVTAAGATSTVTSVAPGISTITATSGGASGTSTVTVVAAPVPAIALSAGAVTVTQGGAGALTVDVTRTSFTAPVTLTLENASAGVTGSFGPPQATGTGETRTLTLTVTAAAATGAQTLTVRGTGQGVTSATTTFVLTVTAPPAAAVTWNFCGASGLPLWLAVQDGSGPWTQVTTTTPNSYTFQLSSGRGGVSYVFAIGPLTYTSTFFGATDEIVAHGAELCPGANGIGAFHEVPIAGLAPNDFVSGAMGRTLGFVNLMAPAKVSFLGVQGTAPGATTDLFVARSTLGLVGSVLTSSVTDVIIRRGIPIASTPATLDFSSAEAFAPINRTLTVQNLGADSAYLFGSYQTANNAYGIYFVYALPTLATSLPFPAIPPARQAAGDRHVLRLSSRPPNDSLETRYVYDVFKDAIDHTSTFGPSLSVPAVSPARNGPTVGFTLTLPVQSQYRRFFTGSVTQAPLGLFHYMQQTDAYSTPGATVALALPDFTTVSGFNAAWALKAGTATWWGISASNWTGRGPISPPYDVINTPPYTDGISYLAASRQGKMVP